MIVVATRTTVHALDARSGEVREARGLAAERPSCLAADPTIGGRIWCGSEDAGVFRSDDGGRTWRRAGLEGRHVTTISVGPAAEAGGPARVWAGTEPSAVLRSDDDGGTWEILPGLLDLPSAPEWSFPPRPETHHVRWIACRPGDPGRIWVAIEAGALVTSGDGGRTWEDRVPGGPYDTHELAIHPDRPDHLHVSAGDGYFESRDAGRTWTTSDAGLEVGYLRSVAVDPADPGTVLVSASSSPRTAYVAGHADGRLYRRKDGGAWRRVREGWPDRPETISPLLAGRPGGHGHSGHPGHPEGPGGPGGLFAADERGVHRSRDGGRTWERVAGYPRRPEALRGLAVGAPPR